MKKPKKEDLNAVIGIATATGIEIAVVVTETENEIGDDVGAGAEVVVVNEEVVVEIDTGNVIVVETVHEKGVENEAEVRIERKTEKDHRRQKITEISMRRL